MSKRPMTPTTSLIVTIGSIDEYGFLGRDHHPESTDAGKTGYVISVYAEQPEPDEDAYDIYHVRLDDGRELELIGHEIASVCIR